jgi:hypothetical protein
MKRLLVALALALGLLLPGAAKAQLPTYLLSQEPLDFMATAPAANDLVAGEGKFNDETVSEQLTLSGHGTPADARGNFRFRFETSGVSLIGSGEVDCLFVTGNRAVASGPVDEPPTRPSPTS